MDDCRSKIFKSALFVVGVLDSNVQCLYSKKDGIPSSSKRNCWVVCFLEEKWMIALER